MKKTKSMRVALGMLALTLITSSFVGGTFAKYVTKATSNANDLARVAKWGVTVTTGGSDLFAKSYARDGEEIKDINDLVIANTVVSSTDDKVVAPGTKKDGVNLFSLTGTPEVAVNVKVELTGKDGGAIKDIVLPAGTYTDYTGTATGGKFTVAEDYHPVKFTLNKNGTPVTDAEDVTLAEIQTTLNGLSVNYQANTDLSTISNNYTLSWAWKFEDGADDATKLLTDQMDTYLGQVEAGVVNDAPDNVSTAFNFVLSVTVTQID